MLFCALFGAVLSKTTKLNFLVSLHQEVYINFNFSLSLNLSPQKFPSYGKSMDVFVLVLIFFTKKSMVFMQMFKSLENTTLTFKRFNMYTLNSIINDLTNNYAKRLLKYNICNHNVSLLILLKHSYL